MNAEQAPGCGQAVEALRYRYERNIWGKGPVEDFLLGRATDLTIRDLRMLQETSPDDLIENVLLPAFLKKGLSDEERIILNSRISEIPSIWAGDDISRRNQLYEAAAAFPPQAKDISEFTQGQYPTQERKMQILDKMLDADFLFTKMFPSVAEHLKHLEAITDIMIEKKRKCEDGFDIELAAARRIIYAVNSLSRQDIKQTEAIQDDNYYGEEETSLSSLLFIVDEGIAPAVSVPFQMQRQAAEAILRFTYIDKAILPHVLWLALSSNDEEVSERAMNILEAKFKDDNPVATVQVSHQVKKTPADREHKGLWYTWAYLASKMETPPGDGLFEELMAKLRLSLSEENEAGLSDESSVGYICGALDDMMNHPVNFDRETQLIGQKEAHTVFDLLLGRYLKTMADPNFWTARALMLNLAESLGKTAKELLAGIESTRSLITRVIRQPDENFSPDWLASRDLNGLTPRTSEKKAAEKLANMIAS